MGTACYVKGSDKILSDLENELGIKVGETTADGKISLAEARCIGECGIAPVLSIDSSKNIGNVTKGMAANIIKEVLEEKDEVEA